MEIGAIETAGLNPAGALLLFYLAACLVLIVAGTRGLRWFMRVTLGPTWVIVERWITRVALAIIMALVTRYLGRI